MEMLKRFTATVLSVFVALSCCVPVYAFADDGAGSGTDGQAAETAEGKAVADVQVDAGVSLVDASGSALQVSKANPNADGAVVTSEDATATKLSTADFGISDFTRLNKGTNKAVDEGYIGYRYAMASPVAFAVVITENFAIAYIPKAAASELGIDVQDQTFQQQFLIMLAAVDSKKSNGGPVFARLGVPFYFTSSDTVTAGNYTYRFGIPSGDYSYASVTLAGSEDGSGGAVYAESGVLAAADDVVVKEEAQGLEKMKRFFQKLDWSPLWVSLKTTSVAIAFIFLFGLLAAWATLRASDRFKGIFDTVFTIPMVLPPTVCGFLLLLFFGKSTAIGRWLIDHGIDIVFTWPAAVIACVVVGFPLMYRTARGAFENLDPNMLDAARTLGWGEGKIFARLMLPLAWPSIAAGTVLAFARAMGEFGATLFFAGNYAGRTQTIPIAIYYDWMGGKPDEAIFWVIVVILISFLVILFINVYSSHTQRYKLGGASDGGSR